MDSIRQGELGALNGLLLQKGIGPIIAGTR
jgi:hypothetical protein